MAVEKVTCTWQAEAFEDLSSSQFTFVTLREDKTIQKSASGDDPVFALIDAPKKGEWGTLAVSGIVKVKAGGTIKAGKLVCVGNEGLAVEAKAGTKTYIVGVALEKVETGQICTVALIPGSVQV